jgi:SAM-dependent methyltransferase
VPHPLWDVLRASYDRSASDYDASLAEVQAVKYDALLRDVPDVEAALAAAPALDLGCGTGLLSARLAQRGWSTRLVGLDMSGSMLARAKPRLALRVQGLSAPLPFADACFGLVAAVTVLRILDAPVAPTLAEVDRVLRPGGLFLVSVLRGRDDGSIAGWLRDAGYALDGPRPAGQDVAWVARKQGP